MHYLVRRYFLHFLEVRAIVDDYGLEIGKRLVDCFLERVVGRKRQLGVSGYSDALAWPKPVILTILSAVTFWMIASKNSRRNASALFCDIRFFIATFLANCCKLILVFIEFMCDEQ